MTKAGGVLGRLSSCITGGHGPARAHALPACRPITAPRLPAPSPPPRLGSRPPQARKTGRGAGGTFSNVGNAGSLSPSGCEGKVKRGCRTRWISSAPSHEAAAGTSRCSASLKTGNNVSQEMFSQSKAMPCGSVALAALNPSCSPGCHRTQADWGCQRCSDAWDHAPRPRNPQIRR